uniref:Uncharacterized protein n=1 Tax=Avena sativa TaxID=4498 RepID=A0ACD5VRM6_AVESA
MQVSTKKTAKEVWDSLKTRFIGADRVKSARLSTLRGEFDKLCMEDGERLDDFAGKISGMAARYASLGATLGDADMVKRLLDSVPDRLYHVVTGIEQFCDPEKMAFEEALGRLKAFDERSRRRAQAGGGERSDGQLLLTAAEWKAREKAKYPPGRKVNATIVVFVDIFPGNVQIQKRKKHSSRWGMMNQHYSKICLESRISMSRLGGKLLALILT